MGTPALELAADTNPNRFLNGRDWSDPRYAEVRQSIARFYREVLDGEAHPYGSKYPETIVTHWSREWEYPWAVLNAELAPGMRVVDLGCGGSPLLPYLARERGCIGVGIDTNFKSTTGRNNLRGFKEAPEKLFPEITWLQESMAEISLADSSMDRAFCISVMEHVARPVVEQTLAHVHRILRPGGLADSEPLGQYLAENHGVAVVPGAFFSPFGNDWIRFSYATPAERTEGAFKRLMEGLNSLKV